MPGILNHLLLLLFFCQINISFVNSSLSQATVTIVLSHFSTTATIYQYSKIVISEAHLIFFL